MLINKKINNAKVCHSGFLCSFRVSLRQRVWLCHTIDNLCHWQVHCVDAPVTWGGCDHGDALWTHHARICWEEQEGKEKQQRRGEAAAVNFLSGPCWPSFASCLFDLSCAPGGKPMDSSPSDSSCVKLYLCSNPEGMYCGCYDVNDPQFLPGDCLCLCSV